ncbi:MAG: hypothetical protein AAB434_03305 [Planctomycetota bacterium]|mgnify:CR=1 FL=1
MRPISRYWILLSSLACLVLAIGAPALLAQGEEKKPEETPKAEPAQPAEETPPGLDKLAAVHGGVVQSTQEFMIETVFHIDGIRLFLYDKQAKPLSMKDVTAHARIEFADAGREPVEVDLAYQEASAAEGKAEDPQPGTPAEPPKAGGERPGIAPPQDSLWSAVDFANVSENQATANLSIANLGGLEEKEAALTVLFKLAAIEEPKEVPEGTPEEMPKDKP